MAGVEIATLGWGSLQNERGDALSGLTPTISGTVYSDAALTTPLPAGSWTSQSDGTLPGFMASGQYTFTEPVDGTTRTVDVVGGVNVADAVQANLDAHVAESPLNVKDYGAVGDGVADDTAELTAALDAAKAAQNTAYFPPGNYLVSSRIASLEDADGVKLQGSAPAHNTGAAMPAQITYTGTTGGILSLASSQGVKVEDLGFRSNNAAFTGTLITTDHSAAATDPAYLTFVNCRFGYAGGVGTVMGDCIDLNKAIIVAFRDCLFLRANRHIVGRNTSYSNVVTIDGCTFQNSVDYPIVEPGEMWNIRGCTFEPRVGGIAGSLGASGANFPLGLVYEGNWHGDVSAAGGDWIHNIKAGGLSVNGNRFGDPKAGGICVNLYTGGFGLHLAANQFDGASATALNFQGAFNRAAVLGNYNNIGTFITGATNVAGGLFVMGGGNIAVASAATMDLAANGDVFQVSGTTGITDITGGWQARQVTLRFTNTLTVTDGGNLKLNGDFSATADDVLSLLSVDGTTWVEVARSNN